MNQPRRLFLFLIMGTLVGYFWWRLDHRDVTRVPEKFTPVEAPKINIEDVKVLAAIDAEYTKLIESVVPSVVSITSSRTVLQQVPLTIDYPVLMAAVDNLQPGQLEDGTAIGTAIATSVNRLRGAPGRSKVLILLTDGVNNRGTIDPRTAAQSAAAMGVRIYTIGVGTEGMAPVPVGRGVFGLRYEMRPVELDEPLLEYIATTSGGRYFRARDGQALQRIYQQIDQLERSPIRAKRFVRYRELFRWPLTIALLALLLEIGLVATRGPLP